MDEKLKLISELTIAGKYAYIKHIDGYALICREVCHGWEEDNTLNLLVNIYNDDLEPNGKEILLDSFIEHVEEYKPNT